MSLDSSLSALAELRTRLEGRFNDRLRRMTLFGSVARGTAGPDSDVDVLVVVDDLTFPERRELIDLASDVWMETGIPLAPLAMSADAWAQLVGLERLLARDVETEGIPV